MTENTPSLETTDAPQSSVGRQLSRLIFVGGSPRSGTTLTQRILDCHPDIYGGPEFDFAPPIMELFQQMRNSIRSGRIDPILEETTLVQAFRSLLVALLLPKLESEGLGYLSEKTPSNVLALRCLEDCAPESRKILVLRDPRDVVSSMLEVGKRQRSRSGWTSDFTRDTIAAVDYMNRCLKSGTEFAETSANCFVVYYEDMVSDSLAVANRMYRFIGVPELGRLDLENQQLETPRDEMNWIDWATPGTISGGVEKDRIGVAHQRLKRSDLEYICAAALRHPLLDRYSIPSAGWTASARWCLTRCLTSRLKEHAGDLWGGFRRRLAE